MSFLMMLITLNFVQIMIAQSAVIFISIGILKQRIAMFMPYQWTTSFTWWCLQSAIRGRMQEKLNYHILILAE